MNIHQGSLRERVNNTTGAQEWVFFLTVPGATARPRSRFFQMAPGQSWPTPADGRKMAELIRQRQDIGVRFVRLEDALQYMKYLYPADVGPGDEADNPQPAGVGSAA